MRYSDLRIILLCMTVALSCHDVTFTAVTGGTDQPTDTDDTGIQIPLDADGDTIFDDHEGATALVDTDQDKTPDYLDLDSDNDGIPDMLEAGDDDLETFPIDTDGDNIPNFRDNDSDQDGIADGDEDTNGNGIVDQGETDPLIEDTDGDGVSDLVENVAGTDPTDPVDNPQAQGNFVFLVPYEGTPQPIEGEIRFMTSVSKVDLYFLENVSKSLQEELNSIQTNLLTVLDEVHCDEGESYLTSPDDCVPTCQNASCDEEESPGTCPSDCLGLCGDGFCIGNENAISCPIDCPSSCGNLICDTLETVWNCPSDCPGDSNDGYCHPGEQTAITGCIVDVWSGAGVLGTANIVEAPCDTSDICSPDHNGTFLYNNLINVQEDPVKTELFVPDDCWGQSCWDPNLSGLFYTVTGYGKASAENNGFLLPPTDVPGPPDCPDSYRGYPCFRPDSLPIILMVTDEKFGECYLPDGEELGDCVLSKPDLMEIQDFPIVSQAVNSLGAKVIGIMGLVSLPENYDILLEDFKTLCSQTGSVGQDGEPLVFQGADEGASDVLATAIKSLAKGVPLDMNIQVEDDTSDAIDAVIAFVDHIEIYGPGTPECVDWPNSSDSDLDGNDDTYSDVPSGMPVCWKLFAKDNTVVMPSDTPQIFSAYLYLWGDNLTIVDTRIVYFVVPPEISNPPPVI